MPEGREPTAGARGCALADEPSETSGVTSALLLTYLDRAGGPTTVAEVLRRCGLEQCETVLRNENCWFSWETKIALFEAAAAVLAKPDFLDEMAACALDSNVGGGLKVALRTLGSPKFVLRNIVGANARFNRSHKLELLELRDQHALLRFSEIGGGKRYHRLDCEYTSGLLAVIPELFGMPAAHVSHFQCAAEGAEACMFELHWAERPRTAARVLAAGGATAVAAGLSALLAPAALPLVGVAALGATGWLAHKRDAWQRERIRHLEREAVDSEAVARQMFASLQDVVSHLRLEEVLEKVTLNAQVAVGGRDFLLLTREGGVLSCQSTSNLPREAIEAVEGWANDSPRLLEQPLVIDDVSRLPALEALIELDNPLRSLASAPLNTLSEPLGVLVALGGQQQTFLPRDVSVLEAYAAQVTIALGNARRFQNERSLAARDPLSGLLNHRSFHEAIDAELARCATEQFHSSVVLIDLDHFKRVNDEDGHAAGDRLLRAVALAISETCRREDLAFRIGGDEFALLLPRLVEQEALEVARRVCDAVGRLDPRIGASAGVAMAGPNSTDKDLLLARADTRLYSAKRGELQVVGERGISRGSTVTPRLAIDLLMGAMELHHGATVAHSQAVADLASAVGARLGLGRRECELVAQGALVHDLGKLAIPRTLLDKPHPLSEAEWEVVREHPQRGAEVLLRMDGLAPLAVIVRSSHERWDGDGYPDGLREDEIPLAARIVSVCDAFDAMIAERPYCETLTHAAAIAELRACAGTQFDPTVVDALVAELAAYSPARVATGS